MIQTIKKYIPSKRKLIQLYFGLLFNANLKGYVTGNIYKGNVKNLCVPGINCYSCPGAVGACPLGSLQGAFSAERSTLWYVMGILLLYAVAFGRMICGWLCPFGLVQDLLYKVRTPKLKKSPITRILSYFKYILLVVFVLIIPITYALRDVPLPAFCKYICPAGTLEGGLGLLANAANESFFSMLGPLFTWKFLLMVSILVGTVFIFRLFCRFLCPLGALYGLFNKISVFGIDLKKDQCINCGICYSACKVDIRQIGDRECISCGECVDVCPTNAIVWKGPRVLLKANEGISKAPEKKRLAVRIGVAVIMLAVLIGAVVGFWINAPEAAATGSEVGNLCPGASLQIVDGTGILDETIDPTQTGRITVINFWGTWCGGCVQELPYFDQIATDYADSVAVIAVHTNMIAETAPAYIRANYPQSNIIFAKDEGELPNEAYYTALGGRGNYPHTVILDETGTILAVFVTALHYEDLAAVIDTALQN